MDLPSVFGSRLFALKPMGAFCCQKLDRQNSNEEACLDPVKEPQSLRP